MDINKLQRGLNTLAPIISQIAVLAVTGTSAVFDLAAAGNLGPTIAGSAAKLAFYADGGTVYFYLNNANSGTADETATSGANRVYTIPAGAERIYTIPPGYTYVVAKGSGVCKLRVYPASEQAGA